MSIRSFLFRIRCPNPPLDCMDLLSSLATKLLLFGQLLHESRSLCAPSVSHRYRRSSARCQTIPAACVNDLLAIVSVLVGCHSRRSQGRDMPRSAGDETIRQRLIKVFSFQITSYDYDIFATSSVKNSCKVQLRKSITQTGCGIFSFSLLIANRLYNRFQDEAVFS
jgi:hypothetical protein